MVLQLDVERLHAAGMMCWLLKDLGWVLLIPQLSWTAALAAFYVESRTLTVTWRHSKPGERLHSIVLFCWLAGNAVWMSTEMLFESSPEVGRHFPWFQGPISGPHDSRYAQGLRVAQALFGLAFAMLLPYYAYWFAWGIGNMCARLRLLLRRNEQADETHALSGRNSFGDDDQLVFGVCSADIYQMVFVGPWVLKDLLWTVDLLWPSLPCALLVLLIMLDCLRRFHTWTHAAEVLWVIGNTVWILGELRYSDRDHGPRLGAGAILFFASAIALIPLQKSFSQLPHNAKKAESTPLLGVMLPFNVSSRNTDADRFAHHRL